MKWRGCSGWEQRFRQSGRNPAARRISSVPAGASPDPSQTQSSRIRPAASASWRHTDSSPEDPPAPLILFLLCVVSPPFLFPSDNNEAANVARKVIDLFICPLLIKSFLPPVKRPMISFAQSNRPVLRDGLVSGDSLITALDAPSPNIHLS